MDRNSPVSGERIVISEVARVMNSSMPRNERKNG